MHVRVTGQVVRAEKRTFQRQDGTEWSRTEIEIMVALRGTTTVQVREDLPELPQPGDVVDVLAKYSNEYRGTPQFDLVGVWSAAWSGALIDPKALGAAA
jgi:ssDNA-binding replication factor A large subunit